MCGRYTYTHARDDFERAFSLELPFDWRPRYNIAPTQDAPIVALRGGARAARLARWGLVPSWADDVRIGHRMINARSETVASKPAFRAAYRSRRCLVPADGWYEWTGPKGERTPHWIHRGDGRATAFAGLWETWGDGDDPLVSYTILTHAAAPALAHVQHRMPVVLERDGWDPWLAGPSDADGELLGAEGGGFAVRAVSRVINSPANDGPACVEAV